VALAVFKNKIHFLRSKLSCLPLYDFKIKHEKFVCMPLEVALSFIWPSDFFLTKLPACNYLTFFQVIVVSAAFPNRKSLIELT
jgi:hypothetical protein